MMNQNEYQLVRQFIEEKSLHLMKHESKPFAKIGFSKENYTSITKGARTFYLVKTNAFTEVLEKNLLLAVTKHPEKFGTGNAWNVIEAIYSVGPMFDLDNFSEYLRVEQFCYVIEKNSSGFKDSILRIDLFRLFKNNKREFVGGIFHACKHFSYNGINLGYGKDINDIKRIEEITEIVIKGYFDSASIPNEEFVAMVPLSNTHELKFAFYYENVTGVHFINTIHKQKKK